ncbi:MAG TPA: histidine kinase dimerization/phospho-acceptor domain-containing protein, partial [Polyangiaceae bacterium]|nr:histidine kinase dimerization/phospho-acceptor domain-containing protein [Polyangiaceae bacterium]
MRAGLRLRLLLLIGGLLIVAFVPLYFAIATYTSVALRQQRESHAHALARAVAGHVVEAVRRRPADELESLLRAEVGAEGLEGLAVYGADGRSVARVADGDSLERLPENLPGARARTSELMTPRGRAVRVDVPFEGGAVVALLRTDDDASRVAPLLRLVALYTALVALALLVLAYYALTRLIVRPLDALGRAAERVASGGKGLVLPPTDVPELADLGSSFRTMTERLLAEEEALRKKIDEVERATEGLKQAQERLVRSERLASVGRLAAGFAHEVGNPIAALMGLQDLLLAGGMSEPEQHDFLSRMRKETERIHRILRDLLAFARPGASSEAAPAAPGQVESAIYDVAALVAPQKAMKEVELELDVFPDLPAVRLSHEQLVQVLLNLVLNAADAVPAGGRVRVTAKPHA